MCNFAIIFVGFLACTPAETWWLVWRLFVSVWLLYFLHTAECDHCSEIGKSFCELADIFLVCFESVDVLLFIKLFLFLEWMINACVSAVLLFWCLQVDALFRCIFSCLIYVHPCVYFIFFMYLLCVLILVSKFEFLACILARLNLTVWRCFLLPCRRFLLHISSDKVWCFFGGLLLSLFVFFTDSNVSACCAKSEFVISILRCVAPIFLARSLDRALTIARAFSYALCLTHMLALRPYNWYLYRPPVHSYT